MSLPPRLANLTEPQQKSVEERLGLAAAERRRRLEGHPQHLGEGKKWLPLQVIDPLMSSMRRCLDWAGLYESMARRATEVEVGYRDVHLSRLNEQLRGLRVLHLSDLHIDAMRGMGARLADICRDLEFDLVVLTGDLRLRVDGPIDDALAEIKTLRAALDCELGCFAVLGNHDCLDLVAPLEALGIRYLLNESLLLEWGGSRFNLAGVDDAHYFGTDDIDRAMQATDPHLATVFLAHSPDLIPEASALGCDFYLCGHTHGGQVCLPGGRAILDNASCPRRFTSGSWLFDGMRGHTSRGFGFSGLPWRSHCQAEVTVHQLLPERRHDSRIWAEEKDHAAADSQDEKKFAKKWEIEDLKGDIPTNKS